MAPKRKISAQSSPKNKRFKLKSIKSIKLVDKFDERYYEPNYCAGICSDVQHKEDRHSFTQKEFISKVKNNTFKSVKSIDLSRNKISYNLLESIKNNCQHLECMLIQESLFEKNGEKDAWQFFIDEIAPNLKDLGIDNKIRTGPMSKQAQTTLTSEKLVSNLKLLFKKSKQLEEIEIFIDETVYRNNNAWTKLCNSFKKLSKLDYIYLMHKSEQQCVPYCFCRRKEYSEDTPLLLMPNFPDSSDSKFNTILKNIKSKCDTSKLKYLRLETDVCPFQINETISNVIDFNELRAINLNFSNHFFNNLVKDIDFKPFTDIFEPLYSKFCNKNCQIQCLGLNLAHVSHYFLMAENPLPQKINWLKLKGDIFVNNCLDNITGKENYKLSKLELVYDQIEMDHIKYIVEKILCNKGSKLSLNRLVVENENCFQKDVAQIIDKLKEISVKCKQIPNEKMKFEIKCESRNFILEFVSSYN